MLSRAFFDNPQFKYFFPDPGKRARQLPYLFRISLVYGISYGEVFATSPGIEGVAIWIPPNTPEIPFWRNIFVNLVNMPKAGIFASQKLRNSDNFFGKLRKQLAPFPHWYLYTLGVEPAYQGQHYASKLLRPMLIRLDNDNTPCYLETLTRNNVAMYRHFGFKTIAETTIPNTDICAWIMLRSNRY